VGRAEARHHVDEQDVGMPKHRVEVIDRTCAAILAAKTPAERVAMMGSMHRTARLMARSRVRELDPHASPEERKREYLRRPLGHGTIAGPEARG
jgi:hypothetical protein